MFYSGLTDWIYLACTYTTSLARAGISSLRIHFFSFLIDQAENLHDFLLGNALRIRSEAIKSWENHSDKLVGCIAIFEAPGDTVVVHLNDELLEFDLREKAIAVGVAAAEGLVDLLLELNAFLLTITHLVCVSLACSLLLRGERVLPCLLVFDQRRKKCKHASHLLLLSTSSTCFDHLTLLL